jgi:hypothetical protein
MRKFWDSNSRAPGISMLTFPYLPHFRLVSEKTVEENILKKSNQKRLLGELAIEGGNFTTAHFKRVIF